MTAILAFLFKLVDLVNIFAKKTYSKENTLRETAKREADINDEAEAASRKASSEDPEIKKQGIDEMRRLISD